MELSPLVLWDRLVGSRARMKHLPPRLLRHIDEDSTILDVGSGDGRLAQRLIDERPALTIAGAEIGRPPVIHIPTVRYDGRHLPFPDDAFDMVMLIDVLHHDEAQEAVLREAARVARRKVLIKDHYWVSRLDRAILSLSDYLGNKANGVPLPYEFLRLEQWNDLFFRVGLRVSESEVFHYHLVDRCKQVVFVVETH